MAISKAQQIYNTLRLAVILASFANDAFTINYPSKEVLFVPSSSSSSVSPLITEITQQLSQTGSRNYRNWIYSLTKLTQSSTLSLNDTTIFIPDDDTDASIGPATLRFHILPRRLSHADLDRFISPTARYFPTLLSGRYLSITRDSSNHITVNGLHITRPNLVQTEFICIHGIGGVLKPPSFSSSKDAAATPVSVMSTWWFPVLYFLYFVAFVGLQYRHLFRREIVNAYENAVWFFFDNLLFFFLPIVRDLIWPTLTNPSPVFI